MTRPQDQRDVLEHYERANAAPRITLECNQNNPLGKALIESFFPHVNKDGSRSAISTDRREEKFTLEFNGVKMEFRIVASVNVKTEYKDGSMTFETEWSGRVSEIV